MRMNMPVKSDGTVDFNATLLALIRVLLQIGYKNIARDGWVKSNCDFAKLIIRNWPHIDYEYIGDLLGVINVEASTGEISVEPDPKLITVGMIYATYILQRRFQDHLRHRRGPAVAELEAGGVVKRVENSISQTLERSGSLGNLCSDV